MEPLQQLNFLQRWLDANSMPVEALLFYGLAALAIPFAYGVITDKVVIRSGFLLIGVFGAISGLFLLLHAQFIALAQIMIYAVGITLVVVIALMLTNPKMEAEHTTVTSRGAGIPILVSVLMFITIYVAIRAEQWPRSNDVVPVDTVGVIGRALTTTFSLPFEFASVLLLAALMGAIMLAKADPPGSYEPEYSEEIDAEDSGNNAQGSEPKQPVGSSR